MPHNKTAHKEKLVKEKLVDEWLNTFPCREYCKGFCILEVLSAREMIRFIEKQRKGIKWEKIYG